MDFKTLVIIFTNNNETGLIKAIKSILNQVNVPDQILIVDNSKQDYICYKDSLFTENTKIQLIRNSNSASISYITSRQIATKYISKNNFDLIILCEDDAYYEKWFIHNIRKSYSQGNEIIMYKIKPNPDFNYDYRVFIAKDIGQYNLEFSLVDYGDSSKVIDPVLIFNSYAFSKRVFLKSKGWSPDGFYDHNYFLYNRGGETEFVLEMSKHTKNIEYVGAAVMYHDKREKRLNNKFFTTRYAYFGIGSGWKFINEQSLDSVYFINARLSLLYLLIKTFYFLTKTNAWKHKAYLGLIQKYHTYLLYYHYKLSKELKDFHLVYESIDWNRFNFNKLKPINLRTWKLLIHD